MNSVSATSSRFPSFYQMSLLGGLAAGIFLIDLIIPLGVATSVLHVAVLLLSLRYRNSQLTIWIAVCCSMLIITAFLLSPVDGELWKVLSNQGFALFLIWATTLMGRYQLQQTEIIDTQEKTIQDFMESLPSACFSFDRAGTILSWNAGAEKIYGHTQKEAVGASIYDLIVTTETQDETKKVIAGVIQGQTFSNLIWNDRNKQDERGWRRGTSFPVRNRQGEIAYGITMNSDFTTQKHLAVELQQANALLEAILNSSTDAIYAKDRASNYLLINSAAAKVISSSSKAILGMENSPLFGAEAEPGIDHFNEIVFSHCQSINFEETTSAPGGTKTFSTIKSPLKDATGTIIGFVAISRDITEWKHAQTDLLLTDRVFMNSPDHISILGRDYRYRRVNATYLQVHKKFNHEILGLSVEELLGQEVFEHTIKPMLDQCFQGEEVHYEAWFTFPNDQRRFMAISYLPLTQGEQETQEIVVIARDLTERKHMEEALQASERQLRTVLDAMPNFVGVGTVDGVVVDCNQAPLTMTGLTREDVIGKPFMDTYWLNYSPAIQEQVRAMIRRASQGEIVREDIQARMGENLFMTVDACYVPVRNAEGQVVQIVHSGIDVTARRLAENALHANEQRLRTLLDSMMCFVGIWAPDGTFIDCNQFSLIASGLQRSDVIGKHITDTYWVNYSPESQQQLRAIFNRVQQGEIVREDVKVRSQDQAYLIIDANYVPIKDKDANIVQVIGTGIDVTARRAAEEALRHSDQQFRDLYESAPLAFFSASFDGYLSRVNNCASELLGYSREELIGSHMLTLYPPTPDGREKAIRLQHLSQEGTPIIDEELEMLRKDGCPLWVNLTIRLIYNKEGQIIERRGIVQDISERKQVDQQLRDNEIFTNSILENLPNMVFVKDAANLRFVRINKAGEVLLGHTRQELVGKNDYDFFPEEEAAFFTKHDQTVLNSRKLLDLAEEFIHTKKMGVRILHTKKIPLCDIEGTPKYLLGISEDITDQKQTEQALLESQQIYQDLVQTIEGIVWECDFPSFQMTFVSQYAKPLLGYPLQQWLDDPHFLGNMILSEDRQRILNYCYQPSLKKENHILEYRVLHANGSILWLRDQVTVMVKDDQPVKLRGIMVNITEQKKIESELKESEQRFRTMFEQAAVGVAQIDSNTGEFIKINQRYCTIVGYALEEMSVKTFQDITHPDDLLEDLDNMTKLRSGKIDGFSMEKRYIRKDGTTVWVHLTMSPMWQTGEAPSHHIAVVQNITERKMMEKMIRQQHEELEETVQQRTQRIQELEQRRMQVEKLAALAQIAAGVAHEINNPLASISQSFVLLKRAIPQEHPHFRYIAKTEDCIDRIAQITKHLYQLYRPSSPTPTPIDLRMPIQHAVEIMQDRASKHHISITMVTLSTPVIATVPSGEFTQVLCNLLQNAIDASHTKDTIDVHVASQSETLTITVADHGLGIAQEVASQIFEPFFTTKQNYSEGGMGLGLSISYSLVESMGGMLDFSTTIGHGTTFRITLPIISAQDGGAHDRKRNDSTR